MNAGESFPQIRLQNLCSFTSLGFIWLLTQPLFSEIIKVSRHMTDNVVQNSSNPSEGTLIPPPEADSRLFCVSPAHLCQLFNYHRRVCSAERPGIQTYCCSGGFARVWDASCLLSAGGEGRKREGERGSLNKSPSVYLIYGAIRSVRCRPEIEF